MKFDSTESSQLILLSLFFIVILFSSILIGKENFIKSNSAEINLIGRVPYGKCTSIFAQNDTVYYSIAEYIVIQDFSNQNQKKIINRVPTGGGGNLIQQGPYFFIQYDYTLRIYRAIGDQLKLLSSISPPGQAIYDFSYGGEYICIATSRGMELYNVSDIYNPVREKFYWVEKDCYMVHWDGRYAYLSVSGDYNLEIIDVFNGSYPEAIGKYSLYGTNVKDMVIENDTLYATLGRHNLHIIDATIKK